MAGRGPAQKAIQEQGQIADIAGHRAGMIQARLTGTMPLVLSLPKVGLQAATPQYVDGRTSEPPVCVPKAPRHMPMAKAAADPLLEPPGVWTRFQGLRVGEGSKQANSTVTVFPRITAPARRRAATSGESAGATWWPHSGDPAPVEALGRQ